MKEYKRLWMILGLIMVGSFTLLGYFGKEVYNERPPIPAEFVDESGKTIYTEADILAGQSAWQSIGGMSVGTVWGHGAYQAPDWTADWIHREVLGWLDQQAQRDLASPTTSFLNAIRRRCITTRSRRSARTLTIRQPARSPFLPTASALSKVLPPITTNCSAAPRNCTNCAKPMR